MTLLKNRVFLTITTSIIFAFISFFSLADSLANSKEQLRAHIKALAGSEGIGARVAGSQEEKLAADYIVKQFETAGLSTVSIPFKAKVNEKELNSQNIIATIDAKSNLTFVIGGHYDSVPENSGSLGVIDNAASIALMLELAKYIKSETVPTINFVFVAFGAEEVGLQGAYHYVNSLSQKERSSIIGMLNLDSITGGDKLYIHSALNTGYDCKDVKGDFNAKSIWRETLLSLAKTMELPFNKHQGTPLFASGETGGWSDHAPFACAGIPVAAIEASNFDLVGEGGKDGYSQTANPALWNCFDVNGMSTCDKAKEKDWGKIWHTRFDKLDALDELFPGRIDSQLGHSLSLLQKFTADNQTLLDAKVKNNEQNGK